MNNPKISVIVPVYNVEKYLRRCIDSILSQTFTDFEVLLIDDGSTDSSGKICDEYTINDVRIRTFHNKNHGISFTRSFGIQQSEGIYIQFVDSDDWIDKNMLLEMYSVAINENADIVGCSFYEVLPKRHTYIETFYEKKEDFAKNIIQNHWGVLWNKLHKRSLYELGNIHFPKGIDGGEDFVVCVSLILTAKKIRCINKGLYFYNRCNEKSLTYSLNLKKVEYQINATKIVEKIITDNNLIEHYTKELDKRKFSSKYPLILRHPLYWYTVFPESNYVYKESNISPKMKLIAFMLIKVLDYVIKFRKKLHSK